MPGSSGMDMKQLYLAPGAATKVSQEFSAAVDKLDKLRTKVLGWNFDLGMGECAEGTSWNDAIAALTTGQSASILAVIDAHIKTVKTWAEWAKVAQNEYDSTDHTGADSFKKLTEYVDDDRKIPVYPPPTYS